MKQFIKDVLSYLKEVHSDSKGQASSKRHYGGIGFLSGLILAGMGIPVDVVIAVLSVSAAMLGADAVADIWKK